MRTCGDHGYIATPGELWAWFLTTNALARSLGLMPFKDVFRTDPEVAGDHGEPEALLSRFRPARSGWATGWAATTPRWRCAPAGPTAC